MPGGVGFAVFKRNVVCVTSISFPFSGRGGRASERAMQRNAPGVSKKWEEVGRGVRKEEGLRWKGILYFFALARSYVPFAC